MKKILSIIGCVVVLAASSCTKKYITPNPNLTVFKTINPSDWVLSSDGTSYSVNLDVAEIGSDFNHYGGVLVAISYPQSDNSEVYEQLPETYGGTAYSYTYNTGSVAIYAQSPDGTSTAANKPTLPVSVKIILVASSN